MDPLSHVLALLSPRAAEWRTVEGRGAWTLRFLPAPEVVVFGQMVEGDCEVVRDDGIRFAAGHGDFLLMVSPPPWEIRALGGGPPVELKALLAEPTRLSVPSGPATRLMAGHFKFAPAGAELIARLMLPIVHVRAEEVASGRLGVLLALLDGEMTTERPGGSEVTRRLLEVLLVEALRRESPGWSGPRGGLLAGLADPTIGPALRRLHDDVARPWTVADLARAVGMSRSVFAARFAETVGVPPMEYLAEWRMTLAKRALASGKVRMAEVAERAGYQSVSAFSTAFRRATGTPPSRYARTARVA